MRLFPRPRRGAIAFAFFASFLMAGTPLLDGCGKNDASPAASPSVQGQAPVAAAPTPAAPAAPTPPPAAAEAPPGPPPAMATADQLQDLVSPIALYPDVLVAQILAGSTYPDQVVEAARWVKDNPNLSGDQLAATVNAQPWDPSVKSLTQFPSVLQTMNESLAWTSALGEAYYNQPAEVMAAIQVMRNRAVNAGTLKDTAQQKVQVQPAAPATSNEGGGGAPQQTVIIQPAQPTTVYVPQYNPATVYGTPVQSPPGYTGTEMLATGLLSFGVGVALGSLINNNNNDWNCNWHGGSVNYNNNVYVSRTTVVPGRYPGYGGGYPRPGYGGGYRPPAGGYPGRPQGGGGYPRPAPLPATRPAFNGGVPSTRPYNPANAKKYAANNPNIATPHFPGANTLPNNPGRGNGSGKGPGNRPGANQPSTRPAQPGNGAGVNRPRNKLPAGGNPNAGNRRADPARGYGGGANSRGGRTGALDGVQQGGLAQNSSNRGQASLGGRNNRQPQGGGGQRQRGGGDDGGGGGGQRGGGGGGGGGRGGGGRRR